MAEDTSTLETDVDDVGASRQRRKKTFPDFDDESVACNFSRNTKDVQLKTKSVHQSQGNLPDPPSDLHGIIGTSNRGNSM